MNIKTSTVTDNQTFTTLYSYLDKGVEDMEADKVHRLDEAIQIVKDRLESELHFL